MRWFVRFLLWGALLAYPFMLLAGPYQRLLLRLVSLTLGLAVRTGGSEQVDLAAANVLGIYCAMCMASVKTPRSSRLHRLVLGLAALMAIEWLTGLVAVTAMYAQVAHPLWPPTFQRALDALLGTPRLFSVPAIWVALFGHWELPGAGQVAPIDVHHRAASEASAPSS
jgi:hypothetical protein